MSEKTKLFPPRLCESILSSYHFLQLYYRIFGSRSSAEKLFHDEINEFQTQGALTKVYMCYSREKGEKKEYTTDKIRCKRVSKVIGPVLAQPNSHIFICGMSMKFLVHAVAQYDPVLKS